MESDWRPAALSSVAHEVAKLLKTRGESVSFAETTSSLASAALLAEPGASAFFRGSILAYDVSIRVRLLGWTEEDTRMYKGPTEEIVSKLARNVRSELGTTWSASESGCAGPTVPAKYRAGIGAGYCVVAVSGPVPYAKEINTGSSDRTTNQVAFAVAELEVLRLAIEAAPPKSKV